MRRIQIGGRPFDVPVGGNAGFPAARLFRTPGGVRPARLGGGDHRAPDFPTPAGTPGNDVWPYDETGQPWGFVGPSGFAPPTIGEPPSLSPQTQPGFLPNTTPYGQSDPQANVRWTNPTSCSQTPILASTPSNQPVLSLNYQRNLLVIQNNSTATAPDTTPVFYIGFNTPAPAAGLGVALAAGIGIVFDIICPRDSVYVLQVGGGGATLVVAGVVVQGTYAPVAAPPVA